MTKAVFCIAKNNDQARNIVDQLRTAGFSPNDISVLFPDKDSTKNFAHEKNTKAPEGAATGAGAKSRPCSSTTDTEERSSQ